MTRSSEKTTSQSEQTQTKGIRVPSTKAVALNVAMPLSVPQARQLSYPCGNQTAPLPRLDASRHGGCPVLVFGITPASITDWKG